MKNTIPRGTLIPTGGGEDREESKDILCRIIAETGKTNPKICLITLTTDVPKKILGVYAQAFKDLNISQISDIHYTQRVDADQSDILKKVRDCDLILFSGGKQLKLSSLSGRTNLIEQLRSVIMTKKKLLWLVLVQERPLCPIR